MQRLYDFSTRLLGTEKPQAILDALSRAVIALQTADFGEIRLYNGETEKLDLVAAQKSEPGFIPVSESLYEAESLPWHAMLDGRRIVIEDVLSDDRFIPWRVIATAGGFRSVHFTPLLTRLGGPIGVLATYFRQPRASAKDEYRLIELYARFATEAIAYRRSKETEGKLAAVVENSMDFVGLASLEGRAEVVNRAGREMVGLENMRAVRATRVPDYLSERDRTEVLPRMMSDVRRYGKWQGQIQFRHFGTGAVIPMFQHSFVVRDEVSGQPVALGTIARDMREQKRTEEALREAQEQIAQIARISTLGEFTAAIAHEINQPIAAVINNGLAGHRWLRRSPPNVGEALEAFEETVRQGQRAAQVIDRIRNMVRRIPPQMSAVDLRQLIADVIQLIRHDIDRYGIRVETDIDEETPAIAGDSVQLQQVLLNLFLNAIESMQARPGDNRELHVTLARQGSDMVVITVRDSGMGFAPDTAARMFAPFYTTKREGLGLGLAISRSIVEAHGGKLWADPNPRGGAVFHFSIPLLRRP
jgi:PAS domain S-box-containing protein